LAVLPDGRVVSGGEDRRVLVWDPTAPNAEPVDLGYHDGWVDTVAVLPDGRVVSSGIDRRVLVWNPTAPSAEPVDLGHLQGWLPTMAVLPDGRVITGEDNLVLMRDPAEPNAEPVELGHHDDRVHAVAVLPDGRVVTAGADCRVLVWEVQTRIPTNSLACPAHLLATGVTAAGNIVLAVHHNRTGVSTWIIPTRCHSTEEPGTTP
jgi:WD40 repeat protein